MTRQPLHPTTRRVFEALMAGPSGSGKLVLATNLSAQSVRSALETLHAHRLVERWPDRWGVWTWRIAATESEAT